MRSVLTAWLRADSGRPFLNGDGFYAFPGGDEGTVAMDTLNSGRKVQAKYRKRGAAVIGEKMFVPETKGG